ncbi:MAG: anthrax toxin-like adenylyl cyclase domain-containing protein [Myxococcota bacterium]|nr:anthrax toxin-like adenylyl cyclase domain-containing protein [Myxococcota bacterium]
MPRITPWIGLQKSYEHPRNGMTKADMSAICRVATTYNEIIMFRSTGPWSLPWLELNFPSKSFHVKGKSSDWGPMAGFVPYRSELSKKGGLTEQEKKGIKANNNGISEHGFRKLPLRLKKEWLDALCTNRRDAEDREGSIVTRSAIARMTATHVTKTIETPLGPAQGTDTTNPDYLIEATRPRDGQEFLFLAVYTSDPTLAGLGETEFVRGERPYCLYFSPPSGFVIDRADAAPIDFSLPSITHESKTFYPLEVMTPPSAWETDLPMTGDYDLWSICPRKENFGAGYGPVVPRDAEGRPLSAENVDYSLVSRDPLMGNIVGIQNWQYTNLDAVLDPTLPNTWAGGWRKAYKRRTGSSPGAGTTYSSWELQDDGLWAKTGTRIKVDQIAILNAVGGGESTGGGHGMGEAWEDQHMGNITPRTLRCILALNKAMPHQGTKGQFRRVHHNIESHRPYGAAGPEELLTQVDQTYGDGFPITIFQPSTPDINDSPYINIRGNEKVATLDNLEQLLIYYRAIFARGWYVPRNQAWGIGPLESPSVLEDRKEIKNRIEARQRAHQHRLENPVFEE